MKKAEAKFLLSKLGAAPRSKNPISDLEAFCKESGFQIGLETPSGDWVILDASKNVVARCA